MIENSTSSEYEDFDSQEIVGLNKFTCFLVAFLMGLLSAIFAKTIGAPFERVKLIQQVKLVKHSDQAGKIL
jgi:hypothetical protein